MDLRFKVFAHIAKPAHEVFEAVADPASLSRYFTTGGAEGRLESGATVSWEFADFPGRFPVHIVEVVENEKIVLRWATNEKDETYETTVTFTFEQLADGRTKVEIREEGWRETPAGLSASYDNCFGWSQMLCALKMWVEHGINLREGMFK